MTLTVAHNMTELQEILAPWVQSGKRVALVPTMGALHSGHMALVEAAKARADTVVVSIFVNPKQFGENEDLSKYPRTLEADLEKLRQVGADLVYTPDNADMYPAGYVTNVSPGALGNILCGKTRPGHFDGVATVVTKLFLRILPYAAFFGEKDYQQLCIIRRLCTDLDIPVDIESIPTQRDEKGLALSSRNAYLTTSERIIAPTLYRTLQQVAGMLKHNRSFADAQQAGVKELEAAGFKVDYLELRDADTLESLDSLIPPARLLVAAWLGKTRLIDNIAID